MPAGLCADCPTKRSASRGFGRWLRIAGFAAARLNPGLHLCAPHGLHVLRACHVKARGEHNPFYGDLASWNPGGHSPPYGG